MVCPLKQVLLVDRLYHLDPRTARQWVANIRSTDPARYRRVHDLCLSYHAGQRKPSGERLGDADQIGLDPEVLVGEELARAADPRLHLIHSKDEPVLVRQTAHRRQEPSRRYEEPALPDHRLDDHHRHIRGIHETEHRLLDVIGGDILAVGVGIREAVDVAGERAKPGLVRHRLVGHRHRKERSSVKGVLEDEDGVALGVGTGDLHSVLHRFGAAIEERRLVRTRSGDMLAEKARQLTERRVRNGGEIGV